MCAVSPGKRKTKPSSTPPKSDPNVFMGNRLPQPKHSAGKTAWSPKKKNPTIKCFVGSPAKQNKYIIT